MGSLKRGESLQPPRKMDDKAAPRAALAFEREQRQRESERRKEEAATAKGSERRQKLLKVETEARDRSASGPEIAPGKCSRSKTKPRPICARTGRGYLEVRARDSRHAPLG